MQSSRLRLLASFIEETGNVQFYRFTGFDIFLMLACSVGGVIGSMTQAIMASIDHNCPPKSLDDMSVAPPEVQQVRGIWLTLRLFIGGVLGFVFSLYFIGMLNPTGSTFARIWALSFLVGYAAPQIWALKNDRLLAQMRSEREGK
jgi:hypothetical protein